MDCLRASDMVLISTAVMRPRLTVQAMVEPCRSEYSNKGQKTLSSIVNRSVNSGVCPNFQSQL